MVCVAADLKKRLTEVIVAESLCCEEDVQGCQGCFSFLKVSFTLCHKPVHQETERYSVNFIEVGQEKSLHDFHDAG